MVKMEAQGDGWSDVNVSFLDGSTHRLRQAKLVAYWLEPIDAASRSTVVEPGPTAELGPPYHRTEIDYLLYIEPDSGRGEALAIYIRDIERIEISWARNGETIVPANTKVIVLKNGKQISFRPQDVMSVGTGAYKSAINVGEIIKGPIRRINVEGMTGTANQQWQLRAMLSVSGVLQPLQPSEATTRVEIARR
jgi:hypothetical protein